MVSRYLQNEAGETGVNFTLGSPIPEYLIEDNELSLIENSLRYPVYVDGDILGVFKVNAIDTGDPCFAFGESYAKKLSSKTKNTTSDYFLVSSLDETFVVSENTVELLQEHRLLQDTKSRTIKSSYSDDEIKNAISDSGNTFQTVGHDTINLSVERKSSRLVESVVLSPWRDLKYDQGDTNLCWAVTAWEIGEWELFDKGVPGIATPEDFADYLDKSYYEYGNMQEANECLDYFYNVSLRIYDKALPIKTIMKQIDGLFAPVYSAWYNSDESLGHAVCIYGYSYDDEGAGIEESIAYMESLGGTTEWCDANRSGKYIMTIAGQNLTWSWSGTVIQ